MDSAALTPHHLVTDHRTNPLGIDRERPQLSWTLPASASSLDPSAYRVLVASSLSQLERHTGDLWDSGRLPGDPRPDLDYGGVPLLSRQQCFWKAMVWDEQGRPGAWSLPGRWEMGLLKPEDWQASWIEHVLWSGADEPGPATLFRRAFTLPAPVRRARLYASALGVYEARLNGMRVGDALLTPGWTDYHTRVPYQTYDVTELLCTGDNVLAAQVGDGWYCGHLGFRADRRTYGPRPRFLAQLEVELEGGRELWVATGTGWQAGTGAILASDLLMGETYDARVEMTGWDQPGPFVAGWREAQTARWHAPLQAEQGPPVRILATLDPVAEHATPGGRMFDLGQNIVGWARITVSGTAGQALRLRFAEMLDERGQLYTEALRLARATDTYICRGGGPETYEPQFTFHGFRYIEVTGDATLHSIQGIVVGSDTPVAGSFACSSADINQLQANIEWGRRGNFLSVPTDCPQRDERLGWLGDAQVFAPTAALGADVTSFFNKWMQDVLDAQSPAGGFPDVAPRVVTEHDGAPGWGNAGVIIPWTLWRYAGDLPLVRRCWPAMTRWMAFIEDVNPGGLWERRRGNDFGDWLAQDGEDPANAFGSSTPKDLVATAYWANDARLMAEMADAQGLTDQARRYRSLHAHIRQAFQRAYVTPDGWVSGRTQSGQTLALRFGLLPDDLRTLALTRLVELIEARGDHLTTGFLAVAHLLQVLTDGGRPDVAHRLLHQDTFPSWLYSVRQGATTIWERWDGYTHERGFQTPDMNSFNHYSLGSVGQWLYESVAGLTPSAPGFKTVEIAPQPGPLSWARAHHDAPFGRFEVAWQVTPDGLTLTVTLPPGTSGTVRWPAPYQQVDQQVGAGTHQLQARRTEPAVVLGRGDA